MTNSASGSRPAPPPPPTSSTPAQQGEQTRPWWGPIDVLLAIPFVFVLSSIGALVAGAIASAVSDWEFSSDLDMPVYALFVAVLFQQAAQAGWPWLVARRKGFGMVRDWKLSFKTPDIGYGIIMAIACVLGSTAVTALVSTLVGLGADEDPSNTAIISDNQDSPWIIGVILLVVVGAPLSEEILFRGLILRALDRVLGIYVAVIGSTLLFALPHIQAGATGKESIVLLAGIATIGLILAIGTVRIGRLGPAILAHLLFNAFGTAVTLV